VPIGRVRMHVVGGLDILVSRTGQDDGLNWIVANKSGGDCETVVRTGGEGEHDALPVLRKSYSLQRGSSLAMEIKRSCEKDLPLLEKCCQLFFVAHRPDCAFGSRSASRSASVMASVVTSAGAPQVTTAWRTQGNAARRKPRA
jgi:hypothetical protein